MAVILPTLRQLQFFAALARRESFSKAAEDCLVSQSTLSAAIKELEGVLGGPLVDRSTRRFTLTARGERTLARAQSLLADAEMLVREAHDVAPLTGPFRLGMIPTIGPFLIPFATAAIRRAFPRLELKLREGLTADLLDDLQSGAIDAAILAFPYDTPGVEYDPLGDDPFYFVCPDVHPLAARKEITVKDLPSSELLLLEDGHCLREHALDACRLRAPDNANAFGAVSLFTLFQMVAGGLGVTLAPKLAIDAGAAGGEGLAVKPFRDPAPSRAVGVAWRAGSSRRDEVRALGDVLRPAFA
ncbi:MAG: hydrogen peroxide-inducible genes activator [Pseudomonadota bacterium]